MDSKGRNALEARLRVGCVVLGTHALCGTVFGSADFQLGFGALSQTIKPCVTQPSESDTKT